MKHPILDKILVEWSVRVHDGKPNPKNPFHIFQLKETMEEMKLPKDFIFEFIQSLFEKRGDKKKKLAKSMGLKNIQWNDYEDEQGNLYRWSDKQNDFVQQGKTDKKDKDKTDKPDDKEQPPPQQQVVDIPKSQFKGDAEDEQKKGRKEVKNLPPEQQRKIDHDIR